MKGKKIIYILFLFSSTLFSQKKDDKNITLESPPPDWVSQRPISSSKYIGIGVASKAGNPNYMLEAKKNALYDLTSEIKANISSNSMLYSVQNDNKFTQTFNSLITLKSVENIEGYELVGIYENDKQYWVYYELDKQEYLRQKEMKKKNTISKAAEIIKLSLNDDTQKNYTAGLRKKIQAFSILVPYLNEEISFKEYNIPNIQNIFDLTKDIQLKLQSIRIKPPETMPVLKPYQQKYNPIQVQTYIYQDVLTQFPFSVFYDDEIIQTQDKSISNNNGVLDIVPLYVQASFQITTIEIQPDMELLVMNDSVSNQNVRFLKSFIQMPKFAIQVSIQPINVFIQTKEMNLNKVNKNNTLYNILFNKLKTSEINVVTDSTQADYIVKLSSNTSEDENSDDLKKQFNLYLAQLNFDIYLYNKNRQILYSQMVNDVYGYGSNLQLAGSNAYNHEKLMSRLNEVLFYLKRKIIWY
ncbi:MAG: LPP20 family lipoprotein [Bacteroidia bacterium]|nr:LPP20 family lipoprotein [Bacteroidia bacterium]